MSSAKKITNIIRVSGKMIKLLFVFLLMLPGYVYRKKSGEWAFRRELKGAGLPGQVQRTFIKQYRLNGVGGALKGMSRTR